MVQVPDSVGGGGDEGRVWNVDKYNDKFDGQEMIKRLDMGVGTQ